MEISMDGLKNQVLIKAVIGEDLAPLATVLVLQGEIMMIWNLSKGEEDAGIVGTNLKLLASTEVDKMIATNDEVADALSMVVDTRKDGQEEMVAASNL